MELRSSIDRHFSSVEDNVLDPNETVDQISSLRNLLQLQTKELEDHAKMLDSVRQTMFTHLIKGGLEITQEMELELGELSSTELRILLKWRNVRDEFLTYETLRATRSNLINLLNRNRALKQLQAQPGLPEIDLELSLRTSGSFIRPPGGMNTSYPVQPEPLAKTGAPITPQSSFMIMPTSSSKTPSAPTSPTKNPLASSSFAVRPTAVRPGHNSFASDDFDEPPSLKRGLSFKPSSELFQKEDEKLSIVQGLRRSDSRPRVGYHYQAWSIGYDEIVKEESKFLKMNPYGAELYKMRCRGQTILGKAFKSAFVEEKFGDRDRYEMLREEGEYVINRVSPWIAVEIGVCTEDKRLIFAREWMPNGSLEDVLFKTADVASPTPLYKLSFWKKMNIAMSVAEAMKYVLDERFTNPNIKLSNVMFNEHWEVKLADQSWRDFYTAAGFGSFLHATDPKSLALDFGNLLLQMITESSSTTDVEFPPYCPEKLRKLVEDCRSSEPEKRPTFNQLSDPALFDTIFIEASELGLRMFDNMWRELALGRPSIPWLEFLPIFCSTLKIPYDRTTTPSTFEFKCLAVMLDCSPNGGNVTEQAFSRLMKCVGPFIDGGEIIDQVRCLIEAPWFMGAISAQEAESLIAPLDGKPFLVRFSSSSGKVLHSRVPINAKYNLHEYVALLQSKKKFIEMPRSPFAYLLNDTNNRNYYHTWKFIR